MTDIASKLDPREEHFRVPGPHPQLSLFLRYLAPEPATPPLGRTILYVHGGTFPSALSIAYRFDGRSWRDELSAAGFHVWGLDFHGFGLSDPYPEMAEPATANPPLCRAPDAAEQLDHAVRFICGHARLDQLSLIAHSWGTIVAGRWAGTRPQRIDRLVFFGPIAKRLREGEPERLPA